MPPLMRPISAPVGGSRLLSGGNSAYQGDPMWSLVNGLFLWNGNFNDSSSKAISLTNTSGVTLNSNVFGNYGAATFSGANYLSGACSMLNYGTGPFTLECWANWNTAIQTSSSFMIASQSQGSGPFGLLFLAPGNATPAMAWNGSNPLPSSNGAIAASTNHHFAITRNISNLCTLYVDGTPCGTYTLSSSISGSTLYLGVYNGNGNNTNLQGQLGPTRSTLGVRYTGAFTPPTYFPTHG